jgi:hypothetical protein
VLARANRLSHFRDICLALANFFSHSKGSGTMHSVRSLLVQEPIELEILNNAPDTGGMSFALSTPQGVLVFQERTVQKRHVVDNSYGAINPVAARFHRRRRRELDTPVTGRSPDRFDSSTDYRTPGRGLGRCP